MPNGFFGERSYAGVVRTGCVMAKTVEFHDADMRRAWAEADAVERDAEQNPERIAERRRRLIKWVEARASA